MSPPADSRAPFVVGLDTLVVHAPQALAAFAGHADAFIRKDALNHEVLADALVDALPPARPLRVAIAGMSPATEPLAKRLIGRTDVAACIVDAAFKTDATTMFGLDFFGSPDVDVDVDVDVWLDAKVDLKADAAPADAGLALDRDTAGVRTRAGVVVNADIPAVAAAYARRLRDHRATFARTLAGHIESDHGPLVIFVGQKVQYNQLRFSRALRRAGWRTISVLFDPNLQEQQRGSFDDVIVTDLLSFLCWVNRAPPVLLHSQGWLFRYHVPALIQAYKPPAVAQICETMDLNSFWFPLAGVKAQLPLLRKVWGDDCGENHAVQCACERVLFAHADGVLFEGDEGHQRALGLATDDPRFVNFPTYPLPDFFASPAAPSPAPIVPPAATPPGAAALRLVFAAGIIPTGGRHIPEVFADAQWHRTAAHLAARGCHVDVYNNPGHGAPATYRHKYPEHLALAARHPHYRFGPGALPGAIATVLAPYDYGLMLYDFEGVLIGEEHFANMIPSKFFMYLEAGLPVLVSDRWRATCDVVRAYDIGRAVSRADYDDLPRLLATLDAKLHKQNVLRARHELSLDKQIGRLLSLYDRAQRAARLRVGVSDRPTLRAQGSP